MEFTTVKNYYTIFWLLSVGLAILTLIADAKFGEPGLYASLIFSSFMMTIFLLFNEVLSIHIVDDHLVIKTIRSLSQQTKLMNIREVELDLHYVRSRPGGNGHFYVMRVIRNRIVRHEIKYDMEKINDFIREFNKKKA